MASVTSNVERFQINQGHLIDLEALKVLAGDDEPFICQLLELFLYKAPDTMAEVEKAFQNKDYEGLRYNVHSFKSTVSIFGNSALSELVSGIERMAMDKAQWKLIENELDQLLEVYHALVKEVVQNLQVVKAA